MRLLLQVAVASCVSSSSSSCNQTPALQLLHLHDVHQLVANCAFDGEHGGNSGQLNITPRERREAAMFISDSYRHSDP